MDGKEKAPENRGFKLCLGALCACGVRLLNQAAAADLRAFLIIACIVFVGKAPLLSQ